MGLIGRQFGHPSGLPGKVAGGLMALGNKAFNLAVAARLTELAGNPRYIVEVGCGPGVGLAALLERFPDARVFGVDLSPEMLAQSQARNADAVRSGRLTLRNGGADQVNQIHLCEGPADLVVAVHVLYFWHQPVDVLSRLRGSVAQGGLLALGYRCRQDMPPPARRDFPREGHQLYEFESQVRDLFSAAGYQPARSARIDGPRAYLGWLTTAAP